jgi:dUTP pyrophosphatase
MKLLIKICEPNAHLSEATISRLKKYYSTYKKKYDTDSGIDLLTPDVIICPPHMTTTIHLGICCSQVHYTPSIPQGFYMYPRSSLSGTPLRLANSVGIIDFSYRGELMAKVDNISDSEYVINSTEQTPVKLFQLCAPDLTPISFQLVDTLDETDRGSNGFGSTNINTDNSKIQILKKLAVHYHIPIDNTTDIVSGIIGRIPHSIADLFGNYALEWCNFWHKDGKLHITLTKDCCGELTGSTYVYETKQSYVSNGLEYFIDRKDQ